jgi:hypothetical protein
MEEKEDGKEFSQSKKDFSQIRLEDAVKKNEQYLQASPHNPKDRNRLSNSDPLITVSPDDIRKNFRTFVSGRLAIGLWLLLGSVVVIHMVGVIFSASQLSRLARPQVNTLSEEDVKLRTQLVQESVGLIDSSAKTLYSFLAPLATAVTGYYFSAIETAVEQKTKRDE